MENRAHSLEVKTGLDVGPLAAGVDLVPEEVHAVVKGDLKGKGRDEDGGDEDRVTPDDGVVEEVGEGHVEGEDREGEERASGRTGGSWRGEWLCWGFSLGCGSSGSGSGEW
jgi:hypothetical protein